MPTTGPADPQTKATQRLQFTKNTAILGGLLLAGVDTEGKPGVAWRASHAVGVLPARAEKLKFSQPYLQSDIYGVTTRSARLKTWDDIDKPGVQVAVQAGTFMEPVMAAALKQAKMVVVKPPQTREQELEAGRVDVFMTDYPYSRRLLDNADWARLVAPPKPFFVVPYAYAVKPGDEAWLKRVDEFVAAIKRDGRLDAAAKRSGLAEIVVRK